MYCYNYEKLLTVKTFGNPDFSEPQEDDDSDVSTDCLITTNSDRNCFTSFCSNLIGFLKVALISFTASLAVLVECNCYLDP